MEIRTLKTLEEQVNRKNSPLWLRMNDNSRSKLFRDKFVKDNGGMFEKDGRYWVWISPTKINNGYWLKRVDTDEKVFFQSMKEFGEKNGLSSVKICELLNGKRKTYKGWTAVELREVGERTGQKIKEKAPEPVKVKVFEGATFQNIKTKEVFYIENISEYARLNNFSSSDLYKVARGKAKSYKGLKLFNPLDP
jgi:hypothetical protein